MTYCYPFPRGVGWKSQRFGANPNNGVNPAGGHTGDDWAVPEGTPIHAAADGVIELSGWPTADYRDSIYWLTSAAGDALVLNCGDDGPSFIYGHNSATPLPAGTHVRKGDVIALSGTSGLSTGPHSHVEVVPPGFVINTATYGRVDPEMFFDEWVDDLPTNENEDDMALSYEDKLFIQEQIEARHVVTRDRIAALGAVLGAKLGIDEAELAKALLEQGDVRITKK
jgi:hypothetical protein